MPIAPDSSIQDAGTGPAHDITFITLHMPADVAIALGVACGALVYLTRSHEPTRWRKCVYFVVSLVGGYFLAKWIVSRYPHVDSWFAGFAASAALVSFAVLALDWGERHVGPALDLLYAWLVDKLPKG
ncbi:hypothetical protein FAZ69_10590 [Trinickia terrae]|uniref:Phage holin family protein n=1 Tax=Trinickia terrae TaxID=2571161 RepID=A0A4U1I7J4_9BURK|nr:putative holin [Trinickia terrae]TKC89384.1 hypothetical protein FAZ69_10590 [Trinickia terrae]